MSATETISNGESAIESRFDGPVARITLNRPDHLNCLAGTIREDLAEALDVAAGRAGIRLVIIEAEAQVDCFRNGHLRAAL